MSIIYGQCMKCQSLSQAVYEFEDGRWLGKSCGCWDEELEKIDGRSERDLENLETYRDLIARTKNVPADEY